MLVRIATLNESLMEIYVGIHRTACNICHLETVAQFNIRIILRRAVRKKLINNLSTKDQFYSCEINSSSASLDIFCIYGNRMSITLFTAARHLCLSRTRNSFHFPSYFSKIYFNITSSSLLRSRKLCFPFRFPYWNLHAFLFPRIRNIYSAHLFYLYLIKLIMFGDVYKSRRLSFRNYLQPPLISSHFLSFFTMVTRNLSLFLSLMLETTQISYWTEWKLWNKAATMS